MNLLYTTLFLFYFATPIAAITSARVWTHFYPSCPGERNANMNRYETMEQTSHELDIPSGTCQEVAIDSLPDQRLQNVDHVSVDAELYWAEPFDKCNITVHEIPGCMDPPLIEKEIRQRVGVSECAERWFSPFNQVWVRLDCEEIGGRHPVANYFRPLGGNSTVVRNGTDRAPLNRISHSRTMQKTSRRAGLPLA